MIGSAEDPDHDPTPRVAPPRRPWARWADSVSAALPDGHISLDAVVAYVDEELPPTPARRAAEHVGRCLPCAMQVADQRQARQRLRGADTPEAPSSLLSSLRSIPERGEIEPSGPVGSVPAWPPSRRRRLRRSGS